jgi:type IV pilus assembly protein PilB
MAISDESLYALLLENEFLDKKTLDSTMQLAQREKVPLYQKLIEKDLISDENLGNLISDALKFPFIRLTKISIPKEILLIIPESYAKVNHIIAFELKDGLLKIATANPQNTLVNENIMKKSGASQMKVYFATERDIAQALSLYKQELQKKFDVLLNQHVKDASTSVMKEISIGKIVDTLVEYAYMNKASDVHIEPKKDHSLVRFRVDGVLEDIVILPLEIYQQVVRRIKILSKMRTDEHLSAQDGKMKINLEQEDLDVRVSIVPIVAGEKVVLRLLSSSSRQFGLTDLGMTDVDLGKLKEAATKPYGMILSTGPTGSGKSTSMYAILKILNTREKNIATIEDPVEYDIQDLNQIQVNEKTNLTFAEGLRSILRQDPDIVYVGEIRDRETADIAINSAMTGHLVLSTLHTNDAATALPRLIDMDIEPFLVASTVNLIIAQRLVRLICEKCKVSYTVPITELTHNFKKEELLRAFGKVQTIRMYKGKGCLVCRKSGYAGRVGIFEALVVSDAIRELIVQKADASDITKKAIVEGMTTMIDDGLNKVQRGITTIDEVLRVTKEEA